MNTYTGSSETPSVRIVPITDRLDNLGKQLEDLSAMLDVLITRLAPYVTKTDRPKPMGQSIAKDSVDSDAANKVADLSNTVSDMRTVITDIMQRLQL